MGKPWERALAAGALGSGLGLLGVWLLRKRPDDSLLGKTVLITGGSRGLGLALAREFGQRGSKIAICARNAWELEKARQSLADSGIEVFAKVCDVSDNSNVRELMAAVAVHFGQIDVLVNNAGLISVAPLGNTTAADFERALSVMFWGVLHTTFAVLPEMRKRGAGCIATIASIGGKVSVPHLLPYCCAKFAAVAFSEGLRAELAGCGIRVVTIAPGLMRTGSHLKAEFKGQHEKEAAWFSLSATAPGVAMDASRAARQIVSAVARGTAVKILSTPANVAARLNGLFPGLMPELFSIVNRFLPAATGDAVTSFSGAELIARGEHLGLKIAAALGEAAAQKFHEREMGLP